MFSKKCFILIVVLALLLGGCGIFPSENIGTTEPPGTTDKPPATDPPETEQPGINCQYLPQEVDNPDNLPVLKWVCFTEWLYGGSRERVWTEAAAHEVNQMLADKELPFRIQFVLFTMDKWLKDSQWFSQPQVQAELAEADLIYGMMTAEEMQQYLMPITEYAQGTAEPSLVNLVPHEYNWLRATVEDRIYGIPTYPTRENASAWIIDPELLTQCGLTEEAFTAKFWEMDAVFAQIYEKNGKKPFLELGNDGISTSQNANGGGVASSYPAVLKKLLSPYLEKICAIYAIDYTLDTPAVVNLLETEQAGQLREAIIRYREAGYIATSSEAAKLSYQADVAASLGKVVVPVEEGFFWSTRPSWSTSGIAAGSQYKAEALSLLNLMAEDEAFRMQLFYGKEGRDYTVENGYYVLKEDENGASYSLDLLSPLSYFCGLTADPEAEVYLPLSPSTENWNFPIEEGKTMLETHRDRLDQSVVAYSIVMDFSGFEEELAAMEKIYSRYFFRYSLLTEQEYRQMLQELEAAGSKRILEALQEQLTQWQKANPGA